ncbi:cupin domain-containing protein [Maribellus maritimus]|uniref:cupin domain-containing protein n=1 Tax=Maribellus maritimus TaxID=2870838 RepID=UPI001EEBB2C6|nr:cupin domain-containing protein [Maribellus maritimus]
MIKTTSENKNYKAVDIGPLAELAKHEFIHPKFKTTDKGRIFIGELLQTTGAEISFRELPAGTVISFLHKHIKHEEIYVFLKGSGQFQVDDDAFQISEGSIVKVSVHGSRALSSDSNEPLVYMVIQSHQNTLADYNVSDGYRVEGNLKL